MQEHVVGETAPALLRKRAQTKTLALLAKLEEVAVDIL
jgi:hypothetical protein